MKRDIRLVSADDSRFALILSFKLSPSRRAAAMRSCISLWLEDMTIVVGERTKVGAGGKSKRGEKGEDGGATLTLTTKAKKEGHAWLEAWRAEGRPSEAVD